MIRTPTQRRRPAPRSCAWALLAAAAILLAARPAGAAAAQDRFRLGAEGWHALEQPDPSSPDGQLQAVRRLLAQGRAERARKAASAWIKRYPNHPRVAEAYLLRGDAKVAEGNEYKGLYDYEVVIRQYPASEQFHTALEREYEVAKLYASGTKRKFLGMRLLPAGEEAAEIFIRIQERAPGSELGEDASMDLADYYYTHGQMENAAEAYSLFLLNYPRSARRERTLLRTIQANLATFKGPQFDATGLIEAAERLRQYQKEYPASAERIGADALLVRIDESLGLKGYEAARWYGRRGEKLSAAVMHRRVIRDHPQTAAARASMERLAQLDLPTFDGPRSAAPRGSATAPAGDTATRPAVGGEGDR